MSKTKGTKEWAVKNINFSSGCENGCLYCYARKMAHRFGRKSWDDWPNMKRDLTKVHELSRKKFRKVSGWIMSPSSHDITEKNLHDALIIFSNIVKSGNKLLIVTKPRFKCIEALSIELARFKKQVLFRFTLGSRFNSVLKYWEPGAPSFDERLLCLIYAYKKGFATSVSIEPFLDLFPEDVVKAAHPYVTDEIWIGPMNLVHVPKELITDVLRDLYSPKILILIKKKIDSLGFSNIRYKDHFLNILQESEE